jgi:ArsR family transcriptional regulator
MDKDRLEQEIDLLHNRVCYALADPKRILILYLLSEGGRLVNEIAELLGIPQSTVSRHLRVLRERELVYTERKGTTVCYTLADRRIIDALDTMRDILATQLAADASLVQALQTES